MGLGRLVRKAVRKVSRVFGHGGGGKSATPQPAPTPAPEIELQKNDQGEAEENKVTEKVVRKRGKRALKIAKKDTSVAPPTGRNIV